MKNYKDTKGTVTWKFNEINKRESVDALWYPPAPLRPQGAVAKANARRKKKLLAEPRWRRLVDRL